MRSSPVIMPPSLVATIFERSWSASCDSGCSGRKERWLEAHGPRGAVQATMLAAGNCVEQFSILIEDLNFQIAENVPLLLVVGDKGIGRPGLAEKCLVPLRPSAISVEILN